MCGAGCGTPSGGVRDADHTHTGHDGRHDTPTPRDAQSEPCEVGEHGQGSRGGGVAGRTAGHGGGWAASRRYDPARWGSAPRTAHVNENTPLRKLSFATR